MRKLILLSLALVVSAAGLLVPAPATAGGCQTHCSVPNACGYVCCYERCCGSNCVILDCAPPPPCGAEN
jgi:hypothetical protein